MKWSDNTSYEIHSLVALILTTLFIVGAVLLLSFVIPAY